MLNPSEVDCRLAASILSQPSLLLTEEALDSLEQALTTLSSVPGPRRGMEMDEEQLDKTEKKKKNEGKNK